MKAVAFVLILAVMAIIVFACGGQSAAVPATSVPTAPVASTFEPSSPVAGATVAVVSQGEALLNSRCTACHQLDRVKTAKKSAAEWASTVDAMVAKGAVLSAAEKDILVKYLSDTYK